MPGVSDFDIEQGETFVFNITWRDANSNPVNLTGYTAELRIESNPVISLTPVLGGAGGTILATLPASTTARIQGNARYTLDLTSGGGVTTRLLKGRIRVSRAV